MPKVSIIVPVYNTEKYLDKCLNSLVNQTLQDIEIIVVNDGSKDNSEAIINKFKQNYSDKIVYLNKQNGGLSDARNYAIPYVKSEYIGFVDSDDYVELDMFEKMYNIAIEKNLDLVECNFNWEYPNKTKDDCGVNYLTKGDLFLLGRVMVCNKLFKASIIKENNITFPKLLNYEDIEFFYKLAPYFENSYLLPNSFYHYIQRKNSIINNQNEKTADIFIILNNIIEFYKNNNLFDNYKNELEYLYIRFLLGSSFLRIVKIKNKKLKKELLNKSINELYLKFPNWKNNKLLKIKSKKNMYYKSVNKFTFKIYSFIFKFKGA
ncbi:MAG: glycosyltransferase [Clostridia bacterium]|nr:glycosyltransferase [Clostridia bacterium]